VALLVRLRRRLLTAVSPANATEEFFVRKSPLYEVVGQLGMWGMVINGIQSSSLEHKQMTQVTWNGPVGEFRSAHLVSPWTDHVFEGGLLVAYTAAMVIFYTLAPLLYRLASSVFFNLNLLSSDFFGLLFGEWNLPLPRGQQSDRYLRPVPIRTSDTNACVPDFTAT